MYTEKNIYHLKKKLSEEKRLEKKIAKYTRWINDYKQRYQEHNISNSNSFFSNWIKELEQKVIKYKNKLKNIKDKNEKQQI